VMCLHGSQLFNLEETKSWAKSNILTIRDLTLNVRSNILGVIYHVAQNSMTIGLWLNDWSP
jgi:hypothetical protein